MNQKVDGSARNEKYGWPRATLACDVQECGGHGMCIVPAGKCSCFVGYAGSTCGDCSVGFVRSPASTAAPSWCIPATSARMSSVEDVSSILSHEPPIFEVAETRFNSTAESSVADTAGIAYDAEQANTDTDFIRGGGLISERLTGYWIKQQAAEANERELARRIRVLQIAASVSAAIPLLGAAVVGRWC